MTDFDKIKNWVMDNIIGIALLIAGLVFLSLARNIVFSALFFFGGIYLVYLGLVKMKVNKVVQLIDDVVAKLKQALRS